MKESFVKPNLTPARLCNLIDRFLPEDDEAIKAFLQVLDYFVDLDNNDHALVFETLQNHAISKTRAYQDFLNEFLGSAVQKAARVEFEPEVSKLVQ